MAEEKRTVGNLIRSIRENRKISREKLGLGLCSATTLMRYELGERIPDKFMADALLERMGQTWSAIIKVESQNSPNL